MAQALYRKWRPQSFDDVVGQEHVTTTLKNQIATGRIGHAYLFVGSRGCGKTTCARILAKEVNVAGLEPKRAEQLGDAINEGRALDVIEIDAASHTGVDAMRDILDRVNFQPNELRYKVYIVDEVHMLSTAAFNAMLKTLEEPPPHVIFILATTDPQKIPATVLSRCQRFTFKRVPVEKIVGRLRHLCDEEGIEADETALRLIARYATGSLRDAVSLLDQLASSNSLRIMAGDVREALGATDSATVRTLVDGLIAKDVSRGFDAVQVAIDGGADARQVARQMVEYLRSLMQIKVSAAAFSTADARSGSPGQAGSASDLSEAERVELSAHAERMSIAQMTKAVRAFSEAINEMRSTSDAQLPLEMAYLDCVVTPDAAPGDDRHFGRSTESGLRAGSRPDDSRSGTTQPARSTPVTPSNSPQPATQPAQAATPTEDRDSAPQQPQPGTALAYEALQSAWKHVIRDVKASSPTLASLLSYCQPAAIEGNVVTLRSEHSWVREKLDDKKKLDGLISVLNRMFDGTYDVRVFVNTTQHGVDPDDDPVVKAAKKQGGVVRQ